MIFDIVETKNVLAFVEVCNKRGSNGKPETEAHQRAN